MALQSFTVSIGALRDVNNNDKNYVSGEAIYVKTIGGTFAPIFRDLAGTSEIAQDGLANQTNEKGQFTFFVEAGDYILEYQNQSTPVTIVGADYFNNRVEETVNQIIIDTATSRGFRVVGDFASGFTYELANDVAIDGSGNYWAYADVNALPVTVPAGTTPTEPEYSQRTWNSAEAVISNGGDSVQDYIDKYKDIISLNGVADMLEVNNSKSIQIIDGYKVITGNTVWEIATDATSLPVYNGLYAKPLTPIAVSDFISGIAGQQNDAPAFQSAVNAANEGDEILFTSEEYLLNTSTVCLKRGVRINFGVAKIKNTERLPVVIENGQGINAILFIKADDCSVEGGYWEDIKSQGVYAGGVFNAVTPYVTTYSGFRARRMISNNLDNGELDNKFVQTRHISNVDIDTVWSFNHGNARLDKYAQSVSINYGTAASLTNCRVEGAESGGAFNMLYVDKGVFTDNVAFNVTNPLSPIACVAAHIKYSLNMTVANNSLHTLGGEAMKISEGVSTINVTGNTLITEGENADCYCVLQLQGVQGFNVSANTIITDGVRAIYATVHVTESTKRGTINNNFILRNPDSTNPASQGSGIWVVASTQDRDTISIHGNHLYNLDIFANQLESSFIDNNKFYVDKELFVFEYNGESVSSCINLNNCTGSSASNNSVINKVTAPIYPQVAVRATGTSLSDINRNNAVYSAGATKSYVVHDDTSSSCRFKDNTGSNATDYAYKMGSAAAQHNYKWTYQASRDVGTLTSMVAEQYDFTIPAIQISTGNTFLTTKVSMPEALNGVIYSATFTGASTLSLTLFNPKASDIVPGNRAYYFTVERNTVN